jgi:ribosomal protein S18 acetylase RimI-like enzyme
MLIFSTDKSHLQRHFEKDKERFCYHLGDLDDFYFKNCQWAVDYAERARVEECVLIYTGGTTPAVLAFGLTERFSSLLDEALYLLPPKFFGHYQAEHRSILLRMYNEKTLGLHYRFKLKKYIKQENKTTSMVPTRLNISHENDLITLYQSAYPQSYFIPRMLESDKYLGLFDNEKLVAVSGVHVDSNEYSIAVLGNIAVHPDHRNKGLATILTSLLVEELVDENKLVCLNVKADNSEAITVYKKLGFEKALEYHEGFFELKK